MRRPTRSSWTEEKPSGSMLWAMVRAANPACWQHSSVHSLDIPGRPLVREVAAAGRHHMLFNGQPGVGKIKLVEPVPGLLPDLDLHDSSRCQLCTRSLGQPGR